VAQFNKVLSVIALRQRDKTIIRSKVKSSMGQKIIITLIVIILSSYALYATWAKEIGMLKINAQSLLATLGILAVLFSLWKVFFPEIKLRIVSCYNTFDEKRHGLFILKLQTISNVALIHEHLTVNVLLDDGKAHKMVPISVRWKGVIFKMLDIKRQECDYKLLKPLEPDLRICGIKQGGNECYISLRSEDIFEDKAIKSWTFELRYRQYLLPFPNLPGFDKKTILIAQPEERDLYFDDSLFQKISPEERHKLINEL
jgi:hypothetical protein